MAQVKEIIQGNVGRIGELRSISNGANHVINLSVAVTPRQKQGDEWVDGETIWTEVSVWGDVAKNIANSQIVPGTPVVIYGTRKARVAPEYTTKDGRVVPEHVEQFVIADFVAVEITRWNMITEIQKVTKDGNSYTQKPTQSQQETGPDFSREPETSGNIFDGTDATSAADDIFGDDF